MAITDQGTQPHSPPHIPSHRLHSKVSGPIIFYLLLQTSFLHYRLPYIKLSIIVQKVQGKIQSWSMVEQNVPTPSIPQIIPTHIPQGGQDARRL